MEAILMVALFFGLHLFLVMQAVLMLVIGGVRYVTSNGDQDAITAAKNTILYGTVSLVLGFTVFGLTTFVFAPLLAQVDTAPRVILVVGSVSLPALALTLLRRKSRALRWVARFSAFWVHHADRASHSEEMWFALYHAPLLLRARLAWGLLLWSPISGRRSRRHRAQLAAAVDTELDGTSDQKTWPTGTRDPLSD
jgi:hypothetical protein